MGKATLGVGAVLAAGLTCGCSFVFVSGPPEHPEKVPPNQHIDCTSGKAAPIVDTVIAGYQVFRTGYALAQKDSDYARFPISRPADIGIGIALSVLFIASAGYGFATTDECDDAEKMHDKAIREQWTAPRTAPPQWAPPARRPSRSPEDRPAPAFGPGFTSPAPPASEVPTPPASPATVPAAPAAPAPAVPSAPAPSSTLPATGSSSAPASAAFPSQ